MIQKCIMVAVYRQWDQLPEWWLVLWIVGQKVVGSVSSVMSFLALTGPKPEPGVPWAKQEAGITQLNFILFKDALLRVLL